MNVEQLRASLPTGRHALVTPGERISLQNQYAIAATLIEILAEMQRISDALIFLADQARNR